MTPIRILLADDHELVRAGFRALLAGLSDVEVVAEADDGRAALALVAAHRPDVVLMDISMPGLNGLEATGRIAKEFPNTRVIILSMHANEDHVLLALRKGASGYLLKGARLAELDLAVRSVARGEVYLSPAASKHVLADYVQRAGELHAAAVGDSPSIDRLTARQREVLQLIAEGRTVKQIAQTLNISAKTVETHRAQIMERLAIHDLAGLVRYAIRAGIIAPGE
ncbi:MAG TPA: response regulator transcription factor [Roseiflexaceae bacterium]|nr:response regulator transcription factor [Roseiflexaceae bacterium]